MKKLYRSRENRVLAGVLGGVGEYVDTDPVLIRLIYLIITLFSGILPGVIVYIVAVFIVPLRPLLISEKANEPETV